MKAKEELWRERVLAWRSSGLSMAKFSADKGFAHQTLQRWAVKFRDQAGAAVGLARVTRPSAHEGLVLEANGARILVTATTDLELLGNVLRALRAGP